MGCLIWFIYLCLSIYPSFCLCSSSLECSLNALKLIHVIQTFYRIFPIEDGTCKNSDLSIGSHKIIAIHYVIHFLFYIVYIVCSVNTDIVFHRVTQFAGTLCFTFKVYFNILMLHYTTYVIQTYSKT